MSLLKGLYNSTKNLVSSVGSAVKGVLQYPVDTVKQAVSLLPGGKKITDWVSDSVDKTLKLSHTWFVDKPKELMKEFRNRIREVVGVHIDRRTLRRGAEDDKAVAGVLRDLKNKYGETELGKIQGRGPFINKRIEFSEWVDKAVPALDRFPPEMESDEDSIRRAKRDDGDFSQRVEQVRNAEHKVPSESDGKIIASVVGMINKKRSANGKPSLKINKDLTCLATQQSDFSINHEGSKPVDLFFLMNPPIQEETITKKVRVISRDDKGRPQFALSPEEEELYIKGSSKDNGDGTYELQFRESPASFAKRAREQYQKMKQLPYQQFELSLSHDNRDYIYEGDTRAMFDLISQNPEYERAFMGDHNEIGMGIMRIGSKIVINFFLIKKDHPEQDESFITPSDVEPNSDWWFEQIPEEERKEDSIFYKAYHGDGDPKKRFDSGYSLYQLYLFKKRIDELGAEHEISLLPEVDFHPREKILTRRIPMLHIKVKVNNEVQELKLVKGTDFVDVPQKQASTKDPDAAKSVGEYITLNQYFEDIKEKPVAAHYTFSSKPVGEKPKQHKHPEEDTELPPKSTPTLPVEEVEEQEGLSSRVKKTRSNILDLSKYRASRRSAKKAA